MDQAKRKIVIDTRRAEQNRAAQRAFRQRKERYVKELESKVRDMAQLQDQVDHLEKENERLQHRIWELEHRPWPADGAPRQQSQEQQHAASVVVRPLARPSPPRPLSMPSHRSDKTRPDDDHSIDEDEEDSTRAAAATDEKGRVLDDLVSLLRTRQRPPIPDTSSHTIPNNVDASIRSCT